MSIDWLLWVYGLGALAVGVFVLRDDIGPTFLRKKGERLGPNYWGCYTEGNYPESDSERKIVPPKPCKDIEGLAGSGAYAGGKAIKTARS